MPSLKPNDPTTLFIAILLILAAVWLLQMNAAQFNPVPPKDVSFLAESGGNHPAAPELVGIAGYLNVNDGFKLADVKGNVILVDFWTYSCINCQRTTPYLNAWHEKYYDKGLAIVGVHSPEFAFEKEFANVQKAVNQFGIKYPVVLDNDFATWRAYQNRYWPHKFLVDAQGRIRFDHIGEGGYAETESWIQKLLMERDASLALDKGMAAAAINPGVDFTQIGTPEIYLGYKFARAPLGNKEGFDPEHIVSYAVVSPAEPGTLQLPALQPNLAYLEGKWFNGAEASRLESETGRVLLRYKAKNVNIVAGGNARLEVFVDGVPRQTLDVEGKRFTP